MFHLTSTPIDHDNDKYDNVDDDVDDTILVNMFFFGAPPVP